MAAKEAGDGDWLGGRIDVKGLAINQQEGSGAQKPPMRGSGSSEDKPERHEDGHVPVALGK